MNCDPIYVKLLNNYAHSNNEVIEGILKLCKSKCYNSAKVSENCYNAFARILQNNRVSEFYHQLSYCLASMCQDLEGDEHIFSTAQPVELSKERLLFRENIDEFSKNQHDLIADGESYLNEFEVEGDILIANIAINSRIAVSDLISS